jgi:prevent-host-death family protein
MAIIPATEFKAKCLELMDRVAERHETFVITKHGRPIAQLIPLEPESKDSIFGWLRGRATIAGDILGPVASPQDWESLREWDGLNAARTPRRAESAQKHRKSPR